MTDQEFLQNRVEDQIKWYDRKSKINKQWYLSLKTSEAILAVLIPFLSGYLNEFPEIKYIMGVIGLLIAIIAGALTLYKYQEKWTEYRNTSEMLKHEKYMYLAQAGPYKSDATLQNLAERIETLISKENSNWTLLMNKKDESSAVKDK